MSLKIENLEFSYRGWKVLKKLNVTLEEGNLVCVMGKNGAGKTTMFRCILGLLSNYKGRILIDGKDSKGFSIREAADAIAYIPQSHSTVYNYSVMDMVLMGTTASMGRFGTPKEEQKKRALGALRLVQIEHLKNRTFCHISGGEQQMVLIARAIAQQARILIMDEPCSSLDYGNQIRVMEMAKYLAGEGYLILMSTHNPDHALLYGDQALVLEDGVAAHLGKPAEVLTEEVLRKLYNVEVSLCKLGNSEIKVCIPKGKIEN